MRAPSPPPAFGLLAAPSATGLHHTVAPVPKSPGRPGSLRPRPASAQPHAPQHRPATQRFGLLSGPQDDQFRHAVDLSGVLNLDQLGADRRPERRLLHRRRRPGRARLARSPSWCPPAISATPYAAYVATRMGLPMARMVAATTSNDILARAFEARPLRTRRAAARPPRARPLDIQVASNFERLSFEAVGRDGGRDRPRLPRLRRHGRAGHPPSAHAKMRELFQGASVSEADTAKTILSTLNETGEVIDPHTAVGVAAATGLRLADPHDPGGGAVHRPPGQVPRSRRGRRRRRPGHPARHAGPVEEAREV